MLDNSTQMFLVSLILSGSTIVFTALSMAYQRSHNKRSVRPLCNIHQFLTDSKADISIQNAGLGPMMIHNVVLLKSYDSPAKNGTQFADAIPPDPDYNIAVNHSDLYVLACQSEIALFHYTSVVPDDEKIECLKKRLHGMTICIQYQDIYDDRYEKREPLIF